MRQSFDLVVAKTMKAERANVLAISIHTYGLQSFHALSKEAFLTLPGRGSHSLPVAYQSPNEDADERRLCRPLDRPGWPVFAQTSLLNLCRNATAKVSCHDFSAP